MSLRERTAAVALVVGLALAGAACTPRTTTADPSPAPSSAAPAPAPSPSPEPTRVPVATRTSAPDGPLVLVAGATEPERSLAASRELFDAAPVAVLAPAGQPDAQRVAAHLSVRIGVPLLVGVPHDPAAPAGPAGPGVARDPALVAELDRLGVATVVAVGDVAGFTGTAGAPRTPAPSSTSPPTPTATPRASAPAPTPSAATGSDDDLVVLHGPPDPATLGALTGMPIDAGPPGDAATYPAAVAALAPGPGPVAEPSVTPSPGRDDRRDDDRDDPGDRVLLRPFLDVPLADTVALAVDAADGLAPIATARAAGVPVHLVPAAAPNPQAHASVVAALHASTATHVLALGAAWAAEPALDWKIRSARTGYALPGGGQLLFPRHLVVALYGTPATTRLGLLGEQDVAASVQRARDTAAPYTGLTDRTVVPAFEIIATVAAGSPGPDGNFSNEQPVDLLRPWVDAAGAAGLQVVLDLQSGRSDFLAQARQYEELLRLPHVGLALDPEWRLGPEEVPLEAIGSVGAAEVNAVVQWLADLTNAAGLPPKLLVLHQFQHRMIADRAAVDTSRPELTVVLHVDGQGSQPAKQSTWRALHEGAPPGVAWGWKNFVDEDRPMLTPQETVAGVAPLPDLVTYQ